MKYRILLLSCVLFCLALLLRTSEKPQRRIRGDAECASSPTCASPAPQSANVSVSPASCREPAVPLETVPGVLFACSGVVDGPAKFCLRDRNVSIYFTPTGFTLSGVKQDRGIAIRADFVGGRIVEPVARGERKARINSYRGEKSRWKTGMPTFHAVVYPEVWPDIDIVYEPRTAGLEYTMVVRPGGNPEDIRLSYRGADEISLASSGELLLKTAFGDLTESPPRTYQEGPEGREEIASAFHSREDGSFGFHIPDYDRSRTLVIDPTLTYSSFLGGGNGSFSTGMVDEGNGIAVDASGAVIVCGTTNTDFPTTPGAFDRSYNGGGISGGDAFVAKLSADGSTLLWSTFVGGGTSEWITAMALDASGNVYFTGYTWSGNYPTTAGAIDTTHNGLFDVFVTKLNAGGGSLGWSTFLGSTADESGHAIAVDGLGNIYVAGNTYSTTFPTTAGALDTTHNGNADGFVAKINAGGASLAWSTLLGGASLDLPQALAVDASRNVTISGSTSSSGFPTTAGSFDTTFGGVSDVFVARIVSSGSSLIWSGFLGGVAAEYSNALALDPSGAAIVSGYSASDDFPATPGAFDTTHNGSTTWDVFVAKVAPAGTSLQWATFLGGTAQESAGGLLVDGAGIIYVTGYTNSSDFPTTAGAHDTTYNAGNETFVSSLSSNGSTLLWSTFLGAELDEIGDSLALDAAGNVFVTGYTYSTQFPTTAGAYDRSKSGGYDAFVTKLSTGGGGLSWSTYLGGMSSDDAGTAIAVDSAGNAYLTGTTTSENFPTTAGAFDATQNGNVDVFVSKVSGPTLAWSTYLGGSGFDGSLAVALDGSGNLYAAGRTRSSNFPVTPGVYDSSVLDTEMDCFIAKLASSSGSLTWCSLLGGTGVDEAYGVAVDGAGRPIVAGQTTSTDFPTTAGSYDPVFNGGTYDGFAAKLSADGTSLVWSTYIGGSDREGMMALSADASGNLYMTGFAYSSDYPVTPGAFDTTFNAGLYDTFATKLSGDGSSLLWSTYLGGNSFDRGWGITTDGSGGVIVTGDTFSPNFPMTAGAYDTSHNGFQDVFVTKLSAADSSILWSTYIGTSDSESAKGVLVDPIGRAVVMGSVVHSSFPVTADAYDTTFNGAEDVFLSILSGNGATLAYSTFLGGYTNDAGTGIAFGAGTLFVTGYTRSSDFPTLPGAVDGTYNGMTDTFLFRISDSSWDTTPPTAPVLTATGVSNQQIDLSWTASIDNIGVTGYRVERSPDGSTFMEIATVPSTVLQNTGLSSGTPYWYRIRAQDAAGNFSGYSNIATATTPGGLPPVTRSGSRGRKSACGSIGLDLMLPLLLLWFVRRTRRSHDNIH